MSESNGRAAASQKNRLNREQFYKATKAFEERAEEFKQTRPTIPQVATMLSTMVGFTVGNETVQDLKKMTGATWEAKRPSAGRKDGSIRTSKKTIRDIATSLALLFDKLNEPIPTGLKSALEKLQPQRPEDAKMTSDR